MATIWFRLPGSLAYCKAMCNPDLTRMRELWDKLKAAGMLMVDPRP